MAKLGYICIGTNDFDKATAFYDALFGEIGGKRLMPTPVGVMYRLGSGPMIMVNRTSNGEPATFGNGSMVALEMDNKEQVTMLHAKAIELGGTCEGLPGQRGPFGEFSYFRDLDGNKIAVYFSGR